MAANNSAVLTGNLTRDPEARTTKTGKKIVNFSLAVKRRFQKDKTDFIDVQVWDKTADFVASNVRKGDMISVAGELNQDVWEDKDTKQKRSKVFLNGQDVTAIKLKSWDEKNRGDSDDSDSGVDVEVETDGDEDIPF